MSQLNRNTTATLNALGKIFDKKTVAEQQQLATVFSQEAFTLVGDISAQVRQNLLNAAIDPKTDPKVAAADLQQANMWAEGGVYKIALHALVGGITSDFAGGSFATGVSGAGFNEIVQNYLAKITNPTLHILASALVGAAAAKAIGGNTQLGGAIAASATKYNFLSHWQQEQRLNAVEAGDWKTVAYWDEIDEAQNQVCTLMNINYQSIDWEAPKNAGLLQTVSQQAQVLEASPDFQMAYAAAQAFARYKQQQDENAYTSALQQAATDLTFRGKTPDNTPNYNQLLAEQANSIIAINNMVFNSVGGGISKVGQEAVAVEQAASEAEQVAVFGSPAQLIRGQQFESTVLSEQGLTKNTEMIGNSIPDAILANGTIVEVKDAQYVYVNSQFRDFAPTGQPIDLIVSPNTNISQPLQDLITTSKGSIQVRLPNGTYTNWVKGM